MNEPRAERHETPSVALERLRDIASRYSALNLELSQRDDRDRARYARASYDPNAKAIRGGAKSSRSVERRLPISPSAMRREVDEQRLLDSLYRQLIEAIGAYASEIGVAPEVVRADVFEFFGLADAESDGTESPCARAIAPDYFIDHLVRVAVANAVTERAAAVARGEAIDVREDHFIWSRVRRDLRAYLEHTAYGRPASPFTDLEIECLVADAFRRMLPERDPQARHDRRWFNADRRKQRDHAAHAARARAVQLNESDRTYSEIASIMNHEGYTSPHGGIIRAETVKRWLQRAA